MTRDMKDIVKAEFLEIALKQKAEEFKKELVGPAAEIAANPTYQLRWMNNIYKSAAMYSLYHELMLWCQDRVQDQKKTEFTVQQWFDDVNRRALRIASSNAGGWSSDIGETAFRKAEIEAWANYTQYEFSAIYKAQQLDPEYRQWFQEQVNISKAAEEKKKAEDAQRKIEERRRKQKEYREKRSAASS